MDTPVLNTQPAVRAAGNAAAPDMPRTEAATNGFAALLALELETSPAATGDAPADTLLSAENISVEVTGDKAAEPSLPADPLAALQLPALPPALPHSAAPERGRMNVNAGVLVENAGAASAAPANTAAAGKPLPLNAAIAGDDLPDIPVPDGTAGTRELPAQPAGSWPLAQLPPQNTATGTASVIPRIDVPVAQPGWSEAFAQRVLLMAGKQQHAAELHLNPPELGPVSVVLSMENDLANVFFSSPLVPVREAIENAMPTLREALGQAGIQLGETGVSAESFRRDADTRGGTGSPAAAGTLPGNADQGNEPANVAMARHPGLVDTFA